MEILLPPMAWKVDDAAGVEHVEAIFPQSRLQEPADVLLDQDQGDGAIGRQPREVLTQRLIASNNRPVALRRAELVHYVVYSSLGRRARREGRSLRRLVAAQLAFRDFNLGGIFRGY